jgi:DNA-binding NtrC family response regulator
MEPHKLLIVDDQPAIRDMLVEALSRESYKVLSAASAEEAFDLLKREPVDVVISDEKMPGMSGSKFLSIVREKYPQTIRIILTGHASLELAIRAINEGEIYRFFTKPCNIVDLSVTIRQALQQRDLETENQRLLKLVRQQALSLQALEKRSPGITKVKRDSGGAVIIDDD